MIPQKWKTKIKEENQKEVQRDVSHELPDWLKEFRENLVDERSPVSAFGETLGMDVKTLPVLLMNYEWGHEQKWNLVRVSTLYTRTSRRTQIVISA